MSNHGGKRKGAGRPAVRGERKQSLTIRITPTLRAYLDATTEGSIADRIESEYRDTAAFIAWQKNNHKKH
jgi:hypothetical protein